jgi:polyhydroxyalkanoate synthesis regulator phasin
MSTAQDPTAEEIESLRKTIEDLRDELEREREARRAIERELAAHSKRLQHDVKLEWDTGMIEDLSVTSTTGAEYPLGAVVMKRASKDRVQELEARIRKLEEGEVDVVVRSEMDHDALPIERAIALRQQGSSDLSANKERATLVFPEFGHRSRSWSGTMRLDSDEVRHILAEKTDRSSKSWNRNTVVRVMRWVAKLSSVEKPSDRDPYDGSNLIHMREGDKRLELVADRGEWIDWTREAAGGDH